MEVNSIDRILTTMTLLRARMFERRKECLSWVKLMVLKFLGQESPPSMKEVAAVLQITMPSVTVLVEDLVKLGLVNRIPDNKDRRMIRLELTLKGKKTLVLEMQKMEKQMRQYLQVLSAKEQEQLANIIDKMYQGFTKF